MPRRASPRLALPSLAQPGPPVRCLATPSLAEPCQARPCRESFILLEYPADVLLADEEELGVVELHDPRER